MLQHIWKDPVWASVIAAGMTAVLGSFGAYFFGYWPVIHTSLRAGWDFLLAQSEVSNWIIFLMVISLIIVGALVTVGLCRHWFGEGEKWAKWLTYRMDNFFGLRWRWHYDGGSIEGLTTFCPYCDYQVFPKTASAYDAIYRIEFNCDSCHSHLGTFNDSEWELKSKVQRFIQQKIRTDSWSSVQL